MKNILRLLMIFLISGIIISACSDDDDDNPNKPAAEFIAEQSDFANYNTWTMVGEYTEDDARLGGMAHGAGNLKRIVYVNKSNTQLNDGEFENGLILIKEGRDKETNELKELAGMVKRGGDFNSNHNGWEWFMFDLETGNIMGRDANLMEGMCNGCHAGAGKDYSFVL